MPLGSCYGHERLGLFSIAVFVVGYGYSRLQ